MSGFDEFWNPEKEEEKTPFPTGRQISVEEECRLYLLLKNSKIIDNQNKKVGTVDNVRVDNNGDINITIKNSEKSIKLLGATDE